MAVGPLHYLAGNVSQSSTRQCYEILKLRKWDPNERSGEDVTPLHIAAAWGNLEVLRVLLAFGANPTIVDADGNTALDLATHHSHSDCIKVLELYLGKNRPKTSRPHAPKSNDDNLLSEDLSLCSIADDVKEGRFSQFFRKKAKNKRTREKSSHGFKSCCSSSATTSPKIERSVEVYQKLKPTSKYTVYGAPPSLSPMVSKQTTDSESENYDATFIEPDIREKVRKISDQALRGELEKRGVNVGPITEGTRKLYEKHLCLLMQERKTVECVAKRSYSPELSTFIAKWQTSDCVQDEALFVNEFQSTSPRLALREGSHRKSFCYLLLDPRCLTQEIVEEQNPSRQFTVFLDSIFYVGKGQKSRPYQHLKDAATAMESNTHSQQSEKVGKIISLWTQGFGVISLQIFHNSLPVEAFCREAAMIEAIGLSNLSNLKRGEFYGAMKSWTGKRRRLLGALFLRRAFAIYLQEGGTQLMPHHIL